MATAHKPDWDADSPILDANLLLVAASVRQDAKSKVPPSLQLARQWHIQMMAGLSVPNPKWVGRYRGEPGAALVGVQVGGVAGVHPKHVAAELDGFERRMAAACAALDGAYAKVGLDVDVVESAIELAAWAHSQWVRIHPFANGNGRSARIWANWVLVRYGMPPLLRLRPRPDGGYANASSAGMSGLDSPMVALLHRLLVAAVGPVAFTKSPRPFP